jgi:hypothetical protein
MPGLRLLIALPAFTVRLVLLIRGQPRHPMPRQDAMHRRDGDRDLMKALQVRRDPAGAEMIVLAEVEDLADHVAGRRAGRAPWRSGAIAQAAIAVLGVPPLPFVEGLAGNPKSPAHPGDVSFVGRLPQHPQPPGC